MRKMNELAIVLATGSCFPTIEAIAICNSTVEQIAKRKIIEGTFVRWHGGRFSNLVEEMSGI